MNLNNILFSNDAVLVAQTTTSQRLFLVKPFKAQIPVASGITQSQLTVT